MILHSKCVAFLSGAPPWLTLGKLLWCAWPCSSLPLCLSLLWVGGSGMVHPQAPAWCVHGCLAWIVGCRDGAGQKQICSGGSIAVLLGVRAVSGNIGVGLSSWECWCYGSWCPCLLCFPFLGWIWPTQPTQHHAAKVSGYQNRLWHFSILDKLNPKPGRGERMKGEEEEKKKKTKEKRKKKIKAEAHSWNYWEKLTAQPNVCAGRTAASQPSSVWLACFLFELLLYVIYLCMYL